MVNWRVSFNVLRRQQLTCWFWLCNTGISCLWSFLWGIICATARSTYNTDSILMSWYMYIESAGLHEFVHHDFRYMMNSHNCILTTFIQTPYWMLLSNRWYLDMFQFAFNPLNSMTLSEISLCYFSTRRSLYWGYSDLFPKIYELLVKGLLT